MRTPADAAERGLLRCALAPLPPGVAVLERLALQVSPGDLAADPLLAALCPGDLAAGGTEPRPCSALCRAALLAGQCAVPLPPPPGLRVAVPAGAGMRALEVTAASCGESAGAGRAGLGTAVGAAARPDPAAPPPSPRALPSARDLARALAAAAPGASLPGLIEPLALAAARGLRAEGRPPPGGLLVSGPSGAGKTHLLSALGDTLRGAGVAVLCAPPLRRLVEEGSASGAAARGAAGDDRGAASGAHAAGELLREAALRAPCLVVLEELGAVQRAEGPQFRAALSALARGLDSLPPGVVVAGSCVTLGDVDHLLLGPRRFRCVFHMAALPAGPAGELLRAAAPGVSAEEAAAAGRAGAGMLPAQLAAAAAEHARGGCDLVEAVARERAAHAPVGEPPPSVGADDPSPGSPPAEPPPPGVPDWVAAPFAHLVGAREAMRLVAELVARPLQRGAPPCRGILFHGPPGSGKTAAAMALAAMLCDAAPAARRGLPAFNFVQVSAAAVLSKVVGASEKALQGVFDRARACAPVVVFIDQLEQVAGLRGRAATAKAVDRTLSTLLCELDGAGRREEMLLFVGATSRKDLLDPSVLRSGRLDVHVALRPPSEEQCAALLRRSLLPHAAPGRAAAAAAACGDAAALLCSAGGSAAAAAAVASAAKMAALRAAADAAEPAAAVGPGHIEAAVRQVIAEQCAPA
eukprot:TRINITY_DN5517_c1_g1_i2.p2 TRINITY_DN5517_c1_g1~~TRINITY_DN5517_c1_g1_i2.p2  ORF type:complete len:695 (+),score=227.23 TRINITY_DN5517_c1_g1_i2:473-2557(+)